MYVLKYQVTWKAIICSFIAGISPILSSPAMSKPTTFRFLNSSQRSTISRDQSVDAVKEETNEYYILLETAEDHFGI